MMVSQSDFCASFECWVSCRQSAWTIHDSFDAITWGKSDNHEWVPVHLQWQQRGLHNIGHQITYPGSNFIFHDSQGFESGSTEELEIAWEFIEKKSTETELKNQLHAIWYLCFIPLHYWLTKLFIGTVYPWTVPVPSYLQNLNSSVKGQAVVSSNEFISYLVGFGEIVYPQLLLPPFHWPNCHKIY